MSKLLQFLLVITFLFTAFSCTKSGDTELPSKKTEKKDENTIKGGLPPSKTFLVEDANTIINVSKTSSLFNKNNSIIKEKLEKVEEQLKITEDSKAYYINGDFKDMNLKNIKVSVKNNHVKVIMDLEKQIGDTTKTSIFTRVFPITHSIDKSKIETVTKDDKLSITIPKL